MARSSFPSPSKSAETKETGDLPVSSTGFGNSGLALAGDESARATERVKTIVMAREASRTRKFPRRIKARDDKLPFAALRQSSLTGGDRSHGSTCPRSEESF